MARKAKTSKAKSHRMTAAAAAAINPLPQDKVIKWKAASPFSQQGSIQLWFADGSTYAMLSSHGDLAFTLTMLQSGPCYKFISPRGIYTLERS
jgi:hypothetical protein